jgi:hypothetical protein
VVAEVASLDVILIVYFLFGFATFGFGLWAIIDAAVRPNLAFQFAGASKALWITLVAAFSLFCGPIGVIFSLIYLLSIRPKVKAAQVSMPAGAYCGAPSPNPGAGGNAGWYPDPRNSSVEWYWDGRQYTTQRAAAMPPPTPPPPA